jgi:hypothetical protein
MAEPANKNGLKVLVGILGAILLGTLVYTVTLYQEKQENEAILTQERDLVVEDLNSLKSEYDKAILESNATNEELVAARNNIAKYIDSVKTMKANLATLSRYRRQVDVLKQEREELLKQVAELRQSNAMITMQRDSTYAELERQTLFNDSLVVQNTQLADAVERGSALSLARLSVDAVRERNTGKMVSTTRASRTDKIKVCFTVAENAIAQAGDREFYLEILDPKGNVMGQGSTRSVANGPTITYTKSTSFYYENDNLDVCDYIGATFNGFASGNYMVNVYDDKLKLLATNKFELK